MVAHCVGVSFAGRSDQPATSALLSDPVRVTRSTQPFASTEAAVMAIGGSFADRIGDKGTARPDRAVPVGP